MGKTLLRLWRDESGQDLTEYVLLLVLVASATVAALGPFAAALEYAYVRLNTQVAT